MRVGRAVHQRLAGADAVALAAPACACPWGSGTRSASPTSGVMRTLRLPLVSLPKRHDAVDLGDDGVILRLAGFEELGDARQTAGDVLGLRGLARDLGDDVAGLDAVAFVARRCCADRQEVARVERRCSGSFSGLARLGVLDARCAGGDPRPCDSMTILRERPVTSSSCSCIVTPSTMSPYFTMPPTSVRIGIANGIPLGEQRRPA